MGMLRVDEGDHLGLVVQIMKAMNTRKLAGTLGEDLEDELKRLPWKDAVYVTKQLMNMGRKHLYDKCYTSLLALIDEVNTKKEEIKKAQHFKEEVAPKYQCGRYLVDLQGAIVGEIQQWHKHTNPPLKFLGQEVATRTGAECYFDPIPNIDEYGQLGFPQTWSPLVDEYLKGYYRVLHSTEGYGDNGRMEAYCKNFYKLLQEERRKQKESLFKQKKEASLAAAKGAL